MLALLSSFSYESFLLGELFVSIVFSGALYLAIGLVEAVREDRSYESLWKMLVDEEEVKVAYECF